MTTEDVTSDTTSGENLAILEANLAKVEKLTQRLLAVMQNGRDVPSALQGPSPELYTKALGAYWSDMMNNPSKMMEHQIGLWSKSVAQFSQMQATLTGDDIAVDSGPKDRRFAHDMWDTVPYFKLIKQQYLANAQSLQDAIAGIEGLEGEERKRLEFFSSQISDMFSPTNFLPTNPEALSLAVETEGQSLVQGLENLVADLEANKGDLVVTLADPKAFVVGENLASTPGSVVFRNKMFELIQYAPTTKQVHETPLIIFPPWINKFYVLDLTAKNSMIKWIVDQGFTLFVVSWVNPDATYKDVGLADYIEDGYLTAIEQTKQICDVERVNAVGYCIGGTTLSLSLALMKERGDRSVNAATLFTTMTDFSDRGEVGVFLDNDFVDGIEAQVQADGMLDCFFMSRTFSYLRSNDLIYGPAIKSYMLGKAPPAFDLLYWNGDGTNLPAKMAVEYLRGLCQNDNFADGGFEIAGATLHLKDVDVPICAIACETDHIAAWKSSYCGVQKMGSKDKTFILTQSGHIAGIVNPPTKNKYDHWTNPDMRDAPEAWHAKAEQTKGSWWPRWGTWLAEKSGKKIKARVVGAGSQKVLGPAPGTYVLPNKT